MQCRRTPCLYHSNEVITNFCREKTCLMPLCPTCIREHSQYHVESAIKPQYYNIYQTIEDVQSLLYNCIVNLQQDKKRNTEIIKKIQSMEGVIKEKLMSTKRYIYQLLEQAFNDLEGELQERLSRINSEEGLHSLQKAQKINQKLSATISELYTLREGLKTDKVMGSAIVFLKDKQPQSNSLHNSLCNYLDNNENYSPKIEFSNQAKNQILYSIPRLIKIQVNKDRLSKHKERPNESRSMFKSRGGLKEQNTKNQKMQKVYTPQKSTAYAKSNHDQNRFGNYLHNNSPYRERLSNTGKLSQTASSPLYQLVPESYRGKQIYNTDFEVKSRRGSNTRKEGQALYKYLD